MTISHLEVHRHPLWQKEFAAETQVPKATGSGRLGLVLVLLGTAVVAAALFLLVSVRAAL